MAESAPEFAPRNPGARPADPALLPFLPMLYVAWADGDLSPGEMTAICRRLGDDCQSLLGPWLDPGQPPTAVELQQMLALIRQRTGELSAREKLTLTGLGLRLAQADDRQVSGTPGCVAAAGLSRHPGISSCRPAGRFPGAPGRERIEASWRVTLARIRRVDG